jgi:hypothetical protein
MLEMQQRSVRKLGFVCLTVAGLALAVAIPLHCVVVALQVGMVALLSGAGTGLSLALVTRTRRPWLIYMGLLLAALTFVPLTQEWPPASAWDVHPWRNAPPVVYGYLDGLRMLLFLVAMPWPFARLGYHAPDPLPAEPTTVDFQDESRKP